MGRKKDSKDRLNMQIIFVLVTLAAIIISLLVFSYYRNPCFNYHEFKACRVSLQGTNIFFYSIPVEFKVNGIEQQNNVVLRTDPRKIEKLNIGINVPSVLLKTRPSILYVTMDPDSNSNIVAASYEIVKFVGNLEFPALMAFTKSSGNNETNVITCEQATNSKRVIWMRFISSGNQFNDSSSKMSSVSISDRNPYCIIIESNSYDGLTEAADAFVLEWLLRITEKK